MKPTRLSGGSLRRRGIRSPVYRLDTKWIKELWRPSEAWIMQRHDPIYNSRATVICVTPCYVARDERTCMICGAAKKPRIFQRAPPYSMCSTPLHLLNWMDITLSGLQPIPEICTRRFNTDYKYCTALLLSTRRSSSWTSNSLLRDSLFQQWFRFVHRLDTSLICLQFG